MKFCISSKILHFKQTLMFILFGLVIGYFSFLSATFFTSIKLLMESRKGIEEIFSYNNTEKDWLYDAFIIHPEKGNLYLERIKKFLPREDMEVFHFNLYMRKENTSEWSVIASSDPVPTGTVVRSRDINLTLEKAVKKGVKLDSGPYFGQKGSKSILIDITSPYDRNTYIMRLTHSHDGLLFFIRQQKNIIITFGLFVLILSTLLGSLFATRLVKPIRHMADKATVIAQGDLDVELQCSRKDDIGQLCQAMDKMAADIRHRIQTMKTMNSIDRAVLSTLSRRELLYNVTGLISDQFGKAGVTLLEKAPLGFQIIATAPRTHDLENKLIKNEDLPEELSSNAKHPLEFSQENLPEKIHVFPEGKLLSMIYSFPLFQDEQFVGVFIISLDELSYQDREALLMLSDQAGVALKSLRDMEKREKLYKALFLSLTRSVDAKSRWTAGHSDRVAELAEGLAQAARLDPEISDRIRMGAMLHDIGKIAIPEAILDKKGKLSNEEFDLIKSHPSRGFEILKDVPDFQTVRDIVLYHHERWDGTGYPEGLAGEQIPLAARVITIADVFDAVTEDRPYRKGFTIEETREFMTSQKGKIFDPSLLELFMEYIFSRPF